MQITSSWSGAASAAALTVGRSASDRRWASPTMCGVRDAAADQMNEHFCVRVAGHTALTETGRQ